MDSKGDIMVEEKKASKVVQSFMLPVSMVMVQAFTMGTLLLSKLALSGGMQPFVLLGYRNIIGTLTVAPFAFLFEREMRKKLDLMVWGWISINATFGVVLAMGLYYYGLRATSPAFSVVFLNLILIVTFVVAVVLRMEKMLLPGCSGKMKVLGTVLCAGGTMVISLYKGKPLHLWPTHLLRHSVQVVSARSHRDMIEGSLFLCGSCLSYAFWFTIQVRLFKIFPSKYWATTLTCMSGSVQAIVIGLLIDRDRSAWVLKWDLQLLTVVYSGVFNTGVTFVLISWAISHRGPIYPSVFNSLSLIVTTVLDSVLLGTDINVGGIVGTLFIVGGLYAFLWGKGKELQDAAAAVGSTGQRQATLNGEHGMREMETRLDVK